MYVSGSQAPFVFRGQLPPGDPIIHCIICKCNVLWDRQGAIGREKQRGPANRQHTHSTLVTQNFITLKHFVFLFIEIGKTHKVPGKKPWSTKRKAKLMEAMHMDYMSREESEHERESPHKTKQYIVRPLTWQSNELKRFKKKLDKGHLDSLPELIKKRTLPRSVGAPSSRGMPDNCPEWGCNQSSSANSSLQSPLSTSSTSSPLNSSTPSSGNGSNEERPISPLSRRSVMQD